MRRISAGVLTACLMTTAVQAQSIMAATAKLQDGEGASVGIVELRQAKSGVWINVSIDKLPAGTHAFHIHETGKCEGDFKSAGGHYAPEGNKHGVLVEGGPHAGDMPNLHVPPDGRLNIEIFQPSVSLTKDAKNTLFDDDGSAFVVHAGVDDYKSQPSGDAGGRIACGVVTNKTVDNAAK